jgi:hypothetical protein
MTPIEKFEWFAYAVFLIGNLVMFWNSLIGGFLMLLAIGMVWGIRE